jgi:quercetin dioxygenase-like cupin family protein
MTTRRIVPALSLVFFSLVVGGILPDAHAQAGAEDRIVPLDHHVTDADTLFTKIPDLAAEGQALLDANEPGVHRTRLSETDDGTTVILFAMHAGEYFSEHAADREAFLQVVKGSGTITLGDEEVEAAPGTWIRLAPNLDHGLTAHTPFVFVVYAQPPRASVTD